MTTLTKPHLGSLFMNKASVGFEQLFEELERSVASNARNQGYPPYNIVQTSDTDYTISIAVAGFRLEDLSIVKDKNVLTIDGSMPKSVDSSALVLHKGIAERNFRRSFTLADYVEIKSASLELGMLNIYLTRVVPEHQQPKKIEITVPSTRTLVDVTSN